ncbi:MAG: hypothetical protein WBG86_15035 [Polyangiales bacterium]
MKTKTKVAVALAAGVLSLNFFVRAEPPGDSGRERRGPPPEAFEACEGATDGDVCAVETPHGTLDGVCRETTRHEELVCVPNDHRPPREDDRPRD